MPRNGCGQGNTAMPLSIYHGRVSRVANQRKAFVIEGQQIYTKT